MSEVALQEPISVAYQEGRLILNENNKLCTLADIIYQCIECIRNMPHRSSASSVKFYIGIKYSSGWSDLLKMLKPPKHFVDIFIDARYFQCVSNNIWVKIRVFTDTDTTAKEGDVWNGGQFDGILAVKVRKNQRSDVFCTYDEFLCPIDKGVFKMQDNIKTKLLEVAGANFVQQVQEMKVVPYAILKTERYSCNNDEQLEVNIDNVTINSSFYWLLSIKCSSTLSNDAVSEHLNHLISHHSVDVCYPANSKVMEYLYQMNQDLFRQVKDEDSVENHWFSDRVRSFSSNSLCSLNSMRAILDDTKANGFQQEKHLPALKRILGSSYRGIYEADVGQYLKKKFAYEDVSFCIYIVKLMLCLDKAEINLGDDSIIVEEIDEDDTEDEKEDEDGTARAATVKIV